MKNALIAKDPSATSSLPVAQQAGPMAMIAAAIAKGVDAEQLKLMMDLNDRWEKGEARKAFNVAVAEFKAESVEIIKGTAVKDGPLKGKFHANLFDVVSAVTPALSAHGLTISWKLTKDEPAWMEVTCTLSHVAGHSESVSMGGAPDTGPGRNAIQARGSAKTYLERYTATAILGLAPKDADNDGAGAAGGLSDSQMADFGAAIEGLTDTEGCEKLWKSVVKACEAAGDMGSYKALKKKIGERKAALKGKVAA